MNGIKKIFKRLTFRLRSDPAQGMVEFALALPILLMLIFGIIEFGRLLQAWLALENGARFGVRYAVTGSYNFDYCDAAVTALKPVYSGLSAYDTITTADWETGRDDCIIETLSSDPNKRKLQAEELSNMLGDYARLPSIREAAMSGAMGVNLDSAESISGNYLEYLRNAYTTSAFSSDYRGNPGEARYFSVSICSTRRLPNGEFFVLDPNKKYFDGHDGEDLYVYPDYCELRTADNSATARFLDDAGGPGDRVRVILTYRHNLITPFLSNWWPTLRLTSQREGLVEKFRTSRVTGLSGGITYAAAYTPSLTRTNTSTVTDTPTSTSTFTPTVTLTRTPTNTPTPTAYCGILQSVADASGEYLSVDDSRSGLRTALQNSSSIYDVLVTGSGMNWAGGWYNTVQSAPSQTFDYYRYGTSTFYNPTNVSTYPFQHTFSSALSIPHNTSGTFRWGYTKSLRITPYVQSYPVPGANTPAPTMLPGMNLPWIQWDSYNFFSSNDFTGSFQYNVVPASGAGPTLACTMQVTGKRGPTITGVSFNPGSNITSEDFSIQANVNGNGSGINVVYFMVYDAAGNVVGFKDDYDAPYCMFDAWNGCQTGTVFSDYWPNSNQVITAGSYRLVVMAVNDNTRPKAAMMSTTFNIAIATRTPTLTFTSTFTPSNTFTYTPSYTPSRTLSPTPSYTPTVTRTATRTYTPSNTLPPTNTFTLTLTRTPITPTMTFTRTNTLTPLPPTNTFTRTLSPTITLTPSNTSTALPPTTTRTTTWTNTPSKTGTPTTPPTITFTPTKTTRPTSTITPTPCQTPIEMGGCTGGG